MKGMVFETRVLRCWVLGPVLYPRASIELLCCLKIPREPRDRESEQPIFQVFGPNSNSGNGFWSLTPHIRGTCTL